MRHFAQLLLYSMLVAGFPSADAETITILSQNMHRFFDDVDNGNHEKVISHRRFRHRVDLTANRIGKHFALPDVIALQEVENRNVLTRLANQIRQRYHTAYQVTLIPGQDISGINSGFLVKQNLHLAESKQLFAAVIHQPYGHPLFSRPPLLVKICQQAKCLSLLNLHLRSMRGISGHTDGRRVVHKRWQQAVTVADWINRFQHNPNRDSLLVLGDFNALTPADRYVDVAGIIRGDPDTTRPRLQASDRVEPDLIDLTRAIPAKKRYSYLYHKNKSQLDYMFTNRNFRAQLRSIKFSRIDYRFSDHAGLIAIFDW